jgi:hypothetical protein
LEQSKRYKVDTFGLMNSLNPAQCQTTIRYITCEVSIPRSNLTTFGISFTDLHFPPVINAAELPLTKRNHPPHAFVKVTVPGSKYKTKAVKGSRDPRWDETIRLWVLPFIGAKIQS